MNAEFTMRWQFAMIHRATFAHAPPSTARYLPGLESMSRVKNDGEARPLCPPTDS
jgi:hypothetical protein